MADFLLNYYTLAASAVIFLASAGILVFGRNRTGTSVKIALFIIMDILIIYFIFILWAVVASGSNPGTEPVPTGVSASRMAGIFGLC